MNPNPYGPPPMAGGYGPQGYAPAYPAAPNPLASKADASGHKPGMRTWFLVCSMGGVGCFALGFLLFLIGAISGDPDVFAGLAIAGYFVLLLSSPFLIATMVVAMVWLHGAWKWLPPDQRFDKMGKPIGPDQVFYLLIPYFHYYWMFPINLQLCHAMDRLRATRFPQAMTVTKPDTAMWAAICEFIPFANFFVAPFLWASYMKTIDTMHEEMQSLGA